MFLSLRILLHGPPVVECMGLNCYQVLFVTSPVNHVARRLEPSVFGRFELNHLACGQFDFFTGSRVMAGTGGALG